MLWAILALIIVFVVRQTTQGNNNKNRQQNNFFTSRPFLPKQASVDQMRAKGYQDESIHQVYAWLESRLAHHPGFCIYPQDDIVIHYGLEKVLVEGFLTDLLRNNFLTWPVREEKEQFDAQYGFRMTVEWMVHFVDKYGRRSPVETQL